ncbi:MAG: 50S ribosomal protein L25/general stress protein Ctc [Proteobacteria bacterium]|nr:50S ribosomal protein L25/general stress protein Ctc [Pseudomonadota bacterium]
MADIQNLAVEPRERAGKGSSRAARRAGRIPAVVYGDKKAPEMITIARNELVRLMSRGTFLTSLFEIELNGKKQRVLPRDLQLDPVYDKPLHVDFLRLSKGATVVIEVPVQFTGEDECPGLKRGGVLNVVRHTIECTCPAEAIPDRLEVSLVGLEINDSIHISGIAMPEGVEPTIADRDFTVATVVAPSGLKTEEEEAAEAEAEALAEGEEGEEGEEAVEGDGAAEDGGGEE